MQTIKMIKSAEGHLRDEVLTVKYNDAHRLIDGGFAKIYKYPDKMLTAKGKGRKGYKVKKWQI